MAPDKEKASYGPGGRGFYGAVTVSERGQVVISVQARRDHGLEPGDKLLVLGDPEQGIALMKMELLMRNLRGSSELLDQIQEHDQGKTEEPEEEGG